MTLRTPAFNDAKQYGFEYLRHLAETLLNSEGVANYATDMVVTNAATGLRVDIAAGAAWVKGDSGTPGMGISQGLYSVVNDAAVANAVTLPAAHASNPRLDAIVLKVRDSSDLGSGADDAIFDYVQGTATAGATLLNRNGAAAIPNDCLHLADVLVPATATNLTAANVRDRRIPANGRATRYISTLETLTTTSDQELATPDILEVYVPANSILQWGYQALGKYATQAVNVKPFIVDTATMTATQLKYGPLSAAPAVISGAITQPHFTAFGTTLNALVGLSSMGIDTSSADQTEVSTGQLMGANDGRGGPINIYGLAAGRYQISMRYAMAAGGGTGSIKERRMFAAVLGNGRSQ